MTAQGREIPSAPSSHDLLIGKVCTATFCHHAGAFNALNTALMQLFTPFCQALAPLINLPHHRRATGTGVVAGHARLIINRLA